MVSAEKEIEANTENLDHDQTSPEEPKAVLDIPKKDPQYTILAVDDDSVNLQVELVRAYVSIEKARFEERLKVEYEVDDSV